MQPTKSAWILITFLLIALIPSVVAPQDDSVSTSFAQAKQLYDQGRLEEAQKAFEAIVEATPSDWESRGYIRSIISMKRKMTHMDQNIMERDRILDVRRAWGPIKKDSEDTKGAAGSVFTEQTMQQRVEKNIPEINFSDARLRDVIRYLSKISAINMVFDEGKAGSAVTRALESHITIALKDVPLIEALKYILSSKGLKYRIDEFAIVVSTGARLESVDMETRYYNLSSGSAGFVPSRLRDKKKDNPDGEGEDFDFFEEEDEGLPFAESAVTIKDVLEQSGVPFPTGSNIILDKRTGVLLVRNTPGNLATIEKILGALDVAPPQVAIEAKFVDIVEVTAQELGLETFLTGDFDLTKDGVTGDAVIRGNANDRVFGQFTGLNDGRGGLSKALRFLTDTSSNPAGNIFSFANVLSQPQFQVVLHALEQSGNANVLSVPRVTTLSNQEARIEDVTEVIYPSEYEITAATHNAAGTIISPGIAVPGGFTTRDTGVILEVTPSVGADLKTISLTLIPEVSALTSWMDFGQAAGPSNLGSNALPVLQPVFTTSNLSTTVVVSDGDTVVLGGLIRDSTTTTEDKIPFLGDLPFFGRAFRSQAESSTKRNLMIFVTAYIIKPDGYAAREPQLARTKTFNP